MDLPEYTLLLLTRRPQQLHFPGAQATFADICHPGLQLAPEVRHLLCHHAELFVHAAADTRFNLPLNESRRTNTEGTRNAIAIARECRRLRHFAYISTLYVAGRHQGRMFEEPLHHTAGYVNTYEESKHEAEELVLAECANLQAAIYRLSSVIDRSGNDGHVRKILRLGAWAGQFRFFPGDPRVPLDIISSDWAAHAISALLKEHAEPGCIRHVCAGEHGSVSVGRIMEKVLAAYELRTGRARPHVDLVSAAEFKRLQGLMTTSGTPSRAFESLMAFIPHLALMQPFDNHITSNLLRSSGVEPADDVDSIVTALIEQELSRRIPAVGTERAENT
jgi:long-chain acyl-CoA synthetase